MMTQKQLKRRQELLKQISFQRVAPNILATDLIIDKTRRVRISIEHADLYMQIVRYSECNLMYTSVTDTTKLHTLTTRKQAIDYVKAVIHNI